MNASLQTQVKATPALPTVTSPTSTGLVQRKCACGGASGMDSECAACRAKRLAPRSSSPAIHSSGTAIPGAIPDWRFSGSVTHNQIQSVSESVDTTRYTFLRPRPYHRFDRIPVLSNWQPAASAMISSPPIGGMPAPRSQTEIGDEEEGMVVEPIQVMYTSIAGAPVIQREPTQVSSRDERKRETSTPDGGSAPSTATAGPTTGSAPGGSGATSGSAPPSGTAATGACVRSLDMRTSGAIEGSYGISNYWPGVTAYWGADKTLGQFDTAGTGGWRLFGHKFQVIGRFDRNATSGPAGNATFQQNARLTTGSAPPGTAGSWFDDMDYVDAGGGAHRWDPNAEAGTTVRSGYPGVRRTLAADTYAYTDPPAIGYTSGVTNTYRKLEFDIWFRSAPGCTCPSGILGIGLPRVQEIQVTTGTPAVLKWPS